MQRLLPVLALLASLLAAGCATPAADVTPASDDDAATPSPAPPILHEPPAPEAAAPAGTAPRVNVTLFQGTITEARVGAAAAGTTACCIGHTVSQDNGRGDFRPEGNATAVVIELRWEGAFDLDLFVRGPGGENFIVPELNGTKLRLHSGNETSANEGNLGAPDRHARLVVTDPARMAEGGGWSWWIVSKGSAQQPFEVALSLFYGALPAEDYSAFA